MRHAEYNIGDSVLCRPPEELRKEAHHGLGSLAPVALDAGELGGEKLVKSLRAQHFHRQSSSLLSGQRGMAHCLISAVQPFLIIAADAEILRRFSLQNAAQLI